MNKKRYLGAAVATAIGSSLCCVLPIVFALIGTGFIGAAAFFEKWRPLFLVLTFGFLGAGFYATYRTDPECLPDAQCSSPKSNNVGKVALWVATVVVLLFAAFPYYSGAVAKMVLR